MARPAKLHGRAFYESIGSPKHIVAPMVDQSEFAWRLLTRSFLPPKLRTSILAYSPMLHAKLFAEGPKYRSSHFEPLRPPLALPLSGDAAHAQTYTPQDLYLDGNGGPETCDRPLFVQFCANDPQAFLEAARIVAPFCDAVDLNLGCPQGIARRGNYGSFLQEDWSTIRSLIATLHEKLDVPVTAKMRVLETKEKTLEYARMILDAGASILTVHGRLREQKGHNTGLADWSAIRYLREQLPPETVIFANGNILQHADLQRCLDETKADGVMSAEGNLYDPSIFSAGPPVGEEGREYFRGRNGKGGYRVDAVLRRYLDIIHKHVLRQDPPERLPLFLPGDESPDTNGHTEPSQLPSSNNSAPESNPESIADNDVDTAQERPTKKQKREHHKQEKKATGKKFEKSTNPNLVAMQPHCFHILRPLVSVHHDVRDALARCRAGDIDAYENVLALTEKAVREGLIAYATDPAQFEEQQDEGVNGVSAGEKEEETLDEHESSYEAVKRCKRPFWVCQAHVRPLPKEALEKGSLQLSKKDKARMAKEAEVAKDEEKEKKTARESGLPVDGSVETVPAANGHIGEQVQSREEKREKVEIPKDGLVCG